MDTKTYLKGIVWLSFLLAVAGSTTYSKWKSNKGSFKNGFLKPMKEVVSIYGDNFTTPESRMPYYVETQRCVSVIAEVIKDNKYCWSFPKEREEMEIVVPDINDPKKFYKYIVYNDTSCECDPTPGKGQTVSQHKTLQSNEINETEYKNKVGRHRNLWGCGETRCNQSYPRYLVNPAESNPDHDRYMLYYQCLPGCKPTNEMNFLIPEFSELLTNHTGCSGYGTTPVRETFAAPTASKLNSVESSEVPHVQMEMLIVIGSTKLLLAAFVLSAILLSLLIVDFNLFCSRKGLIYNLLCCRKRETKTRQQDIIQAV